VSDTPINDGGPAFPVKGMPIDPDTYLNRPGMTLRDYFAAAAMQGMLSDSEREGTWSEFAEDAYAVADAMLKAREGK
jgi:hypothetical protein